MDSLSTLVVSAAKLPILNPNEFDLWKMRIEQYFLMTDYSLWEVIINGDSPIPTIDVDGVVQPISHKSPVTTPILDATLKSTKPKSNSSSKRKNRKTWFVCRILTQSKPVSNNAVRPVCAAVPKIMVTRPRHAHSINTKSKSPIRRYITCSPSPMTSNSPPRVTAAQASVVSAAKGKKRTWGNLQYALKDKGVIDCGCSQHMTGNMSYIFDFKELNCGYVAFGGNLKGGKISGKGKIKTCKLDFEDVYFVKELKFNLFSVSRMYDKKNKVLFTDTECLVLSPDFKLPGESQVLLRVTRENNMYNVNLKNIVPSGDLTCLFAKATIDESNLQHIRLGHINFKTINKLVKGKFEGKVDEGFLVGYSINSKAFRVFNSRTHIVQETLHVNFLENKPNIVGSGPIWLFDIDSLTSTMNYQPVTAGNQSNPSAGFQDEFDAKKVGEEVTQQYMLFLVWSSGSLNPQNKDGDAAFDGKEHDVDTKKPESPVNVSLSSSAQSGKQDDKTMKKAKGKIPTAGQHSFNSTNPFSAAEMEDITYSNHENVGAEADFNNLETSIIVSPIPTTRTHKDHLVSQIIGDVNKKDERGSVVRNKARLVAQGHTQEEGINYKEVFAPVARIEAIRLFLDFASFMGFMVYQIDAKSAFLYGTIKEEVYVCQPLRFEDPDHPDNVYKVVKALYGLHQASRAWYETLANYLIENGFHRGKTDQTLFIKKQNEDILLVQIYVKQKKDGIFISQDKYVVEILKKFGLTEGKSASTPIDTEKPLLKDPDVEDVDVHIYKLMIVSLMIFRYLKVKPHLGLWYPKDLPFDLVAYSDSDYAGASLDRKSTTEGCQFLGCRLILGNARSKQLLPFHPQRLKM
nr:hypothetical protein [Tanacetum cinerariifolium]